ncbi:RHS repeat-associated core domain-containing protein [Shewanella sp. 125m-1]
MQARYYDPLIGRFYSNDPVGFKNVHNFNRYAYAANNPYRYTDPDGKDFKATYISLKMPFYGSVDVGIVTFTPNSAGDGSTTSGAFARINRSASEVDGDSSKGFLKQTGIKVGAIGGATFGKEEGSHTSETFQGTDASIDAGLGPVAVSLGGLASGETSVATEIGAAIGLDASVSQTVTITNEDIGQAVTKAYEAIKETF